VSIEAGTLYIVATPIGNLEDMTPRGRRILDEVDAIAAEDTRHSRHLLEHLAISTPMFALHEHNEREISGKILNRLRQGESLALISDAGTPLISDPGYVLVNEARAAGLNVIPVPGASALITALSAAGLPTDRFIFEGFLPARGPAREKHLLSLVTEARTVVFYESPHRIEASLAAMSAVLGGDRRVVIARELTKRFETWLTGTLLDVCARVKLDENQRRGEFVVMLAGAPQAPSDVQAQAEQVLRILVKELPIKQAARLAADITGARKNDLYKRALLLTAGEETQG
jgi:16S rRNA (cytidine1402-2'-O)-methyltransferase